MMTEKKMRAIMFVCHGNICRSPTAEFVMKDILEKRGKGKDFFISSAATSGEELSNPVYPPARRVLERHGIDCRGKRAVRLKKEDYGKYDLFVCMDGRNVANTLRIFGSDPEHKIVKLASFAGTTDDVEDPWYSDRFEEVYGQIREYCLVLAEKLVKTDN